MKSIGLGGYRQIDDINSPEARMFREYFDCEVEPGDIVQFRVHIVTSERKIREVKRWMKRQNP